MWKKSFVATTVALGDSVDDALAALAPSRSAAPATPHTSGGYAPNSPARNSHAPGGDVEGGLVLGGNVQNSHVQGGHAGRALGRHALTALDAGELDALVAKLRAPQRGARAAALAAAVRDIVLAIDEITLR